MLCGDDGIERIVALLLGDVDAAAVGDDDVE